MGQAKVQLGGMISGAKEMKKSLNLTDKKDNPLEGKLDVTITYIPPAGASGDAGGADGAGGEGGAEEAGGGEEGGTAEGGGAKKSRKATGLPSTSGKTYSTKPQDFQVRVRVQEARQLTGSNISPLCKVSCANQTQVTSVKPSTNAPFWGQTFFFNFHESPAKLFEESLCFGVYNSRKMRSDAHIGSFELDLAAVYESPNHAIMHKWLLLGEPEDPLAGAKGYLKIATVILGPGDEAPVSDQMLLLKPKEDSEEEDIEANILRPAGVQLRPAVFHFSLFNGEDYPRRVGNAKVALRVLASIWVPTVDTDAFSGVKKFFGSDEEKEFVDPFTVVQFAGKEVKSSVKKGTDHPEWYEEMKLAVQVNRTELFNDLFLLSGISGYLPTFGPTFVNLYGSPREFSALGDKYEALNLGKGEGAAYRGRVFCELSTQLTDEPQESGITPISDDNKQRVQKFLRRRKFMLHAAFYQANMVDVTDAAVSFEVSIGNFGNNLDETIGPSASTTCPANAVFDGCYYNFLPWGDSKPCVMVDSQWEDISYRLYAVNMLSRIYDDLEYGIEGIEMSLKVDMEEQDLANTVITCLDELILNCSTKLPEWHEACTPINELDKKIKQLREDDIKSIVEQATKLREEATTVEEVIPELKRYLLMLKNLITEPQNSMPDVIIWMIAGDKRVAYFRIPAYDLLYSEEELYRGRYCGVTRTIQLKVPMLKTEDKSEHWKIPAQVRLSLWLGLEKDQKNWLERSDEGRVIVVAETYENQASIAGSWSSRKPPLTRSPWTDFTGKMELPKDGFVPPEGWKWDGDWEVSPELSMLFTQDAGATHFTESVYYNETRTPATGWAAASVPYTDSTGEPKSSIDEYPLPDGWAWEDDAWQVDLNRPCDEDGFEYSVDAKVGNYVAVEKVYHMARRKRMTRKRVVSDPTKNVKEDLVAQIMSKKKSSMTPAAAEGWEYALHFSSKFHSTKKTTDSVRRRRWHRRMVPLNPNIVVPGVFQFSKGKDESEKENMTCPRIFVKYETAKHWQLRAYIFQARNLLAGDQTGLSDPYVRVNFVTQSQKSERLEKTLCPQWDQTLIFEDLQLHGSPDSIMASPPPVTIEIFDWDQIGTDTFLGRCRTEPVVVLQPEHSKDVLLQWYRFDCNGKDGGELLAAFELILLEGQPARPPPPMRGKLYIVPDGIRPVLQPTAIEVLCWGVRNMKKYQLANVNSPSVEIDIGGNILHSDTISNVKRTPNFPKPLMYLKANLPKEALYMPPINIMVRDNRPFGRKPVVGTHVLNDISKFRVEPLYQPYDPLEKIPGTYLLFHRFSATVQYALVINTCNFSLLLQVAHSQLQHPIGWIAETMGFCFIQMDLSELDANIDWYSKYYASRKMWNKCLDYKERGYDTFVYYKDELEKQEGYYMFMDFCSVFPLHRGRSTDDDDDTYSGDFKGTFRVYSLPEDPNAPQPLRYLETEVPKPDPVECIVRVYVIKATDLQPSDPSGLADPYVEILLGKHKVSSKDHYIPNNLNPEFGRMFQLNALIPVEKDLIIRVIDYDLLSRDDVIGETKIDLENRLLTRYRATCGLPQTYTVSGPNQWRDCQTPTQILDDFCTKNRLPLPKYSEPEAGGPMTCHIGEHFFNLSVFEKGLIPNPHLGIPKERLALAILNALPLVKEHVETRPLTSPLQPSIEQGRLELWVDIFPKSLGDPGPCFNITPRRPNEYVLRVIVWNTYDVILDETSITGERMSDIYVKGWLQGVEEREKTDVHYRSLNGEGNFNWRLIFPFQYIPAENELVVSKKEHFWSLDKTEKRMPAVLVLQVWDNDLFSPDDFLGTLELNLTHMPLPVKRNKDCTVAMIQTSQPKTKFINLFESKRAGGFWPFVDAPGPDMKLTGKLEAEMELLTKEEAELKPAGPGQDEPNANPHLDKPKRPETSFFWFTSPFKTCKFIICKRFKCILITIVCVFLAILLIALFIYAIPQLLARKMVGV
ncbi:unnamed protein product [Schistocephalus solidus]|uniref:Myoferlin n=1 Tax=Schistocephalus solidus TaxID=70667 RepID=A0A183SHB2_SCHSO|nr:unnamed protein product [Schistocephalus solidus]